jgi:hypothetical protein
MSNVIGFLEEMGRDAQLRHADADARESALTRAEIVPSVHAAIASGDTRRLEAVLGARTNMVCGLAPGKQDNEDPAEPSKQDDDEEIRATAFLRVAARSR